MSVIVTSFPITEAASFYSNFFKGFVKENIELRFQDESSCLATDVGGFVKLSTFTDFVAVAGAHDGDEIVIVGGVYDGVLGTVTSEGIAPAQIITDIPYVEDATVRFYFKFTNMRLSYRFCEFTTQDDQSAINLFDTDFTFYPDKYGDLFIDISLISSLMEPSFDFTNEINTDMSKVYQVQYKTVYDSSSDTWHSAHDTALTAFVPFISAHGGGRIAKYDNTADNNVPDTEFITRMWRDYKKIVSAMVIDANDNGTFEIGITEYDNLKGLLTFTSLYTTTTESGIVNATVPTLDNSTRYVEILTRDTSGIKSQVRMTLFDTLLDETEFYLTWASELSTIRNWLFTSKIGFTQKARYNVLQDTEFRGIPNRYDESLILQTKGLSEIEKNYVYDIYLSNKIKLENNGEEFECIISKPSFKFENRSNSYICTIEIMKKERDLMNV